tara:strand:+ start:84 stop:218 length:135 start_codon:yes stop_codon:yes gene_type:complete
VQVRLDDGALVDLRTLFSNKKERRKMSKEKSQRNTQKEEKNNAH